MFNGNNESLKVENYMYQDISQKNKKGGRERENLLLTMAAESVGKMADFGNFNDFDF